MEGPRTSPHIRHQFRIDSPQQRHLNQFSTRTVTVYIYISAISLYPLASNPPSPCHQLHPKQLDRVVPAVSVQPPDRAWRISSVFGDVTKRYVAAVFCTIFLQDLKSWTNFFNIISKNVACAVPSTRMSAWPDHFDGNDMCIAPSTGTAAQAFGATAFRQLQMGRGS